MMYHHDDDDDDDESLMMCFRKNNKPQTRGKMNLIGRLQLSTDRSKEEDSEGIIQLRILRVQVCFKQHMQSSCIVHFKVNITHVIK